MDQINWISIPSVYQIKYVDIFSVFRQKEFIKILESFDTAIHVDYLQESVSNSPLSPCVHWQSNPHSKIELKLKFKV